MKNYVRVLALYNEEGDIRLEVEQVRYDAALHWHEPMDGLEVVRGFLSYTDYAHKEIEASGEVGTRFENNTFEGRLELVHQPWGAFHGVPSFNVKTGEAATHGGSNFSSVLYRPICIFYP